MKMRLASLATAAILATTLRAPAQEAADIVGSIDIGCLADAITGGTFATATSFTPIHPFILSETGVYTGAPLLTPVTVNGFQFNPASELALPLPLWTFGVGGITYSFDATSLTSTYDPSLAQWDIGGDGIATINGYNATPATWNVNLSQDGGSIVFDSLAGVSEASGFSDATAVPESSTLVLLGVGLLGLAGIVRMLKIKA